MREGNSALKGFLRFRMFPGLPSIDKAMKAARGLSGARYRVVAGTASRTPEQSRGSAYRRSDVYDPASSGRSSSREAAHPMTRPQKAAWMLKRFSPETVTTNVTKEPMVKVPAKAVTKAC